MQRYGPDLAPPSGSDLYWRYKYWLHYAEGSLMPPLLLKLVVNRLGLLGRPARPFVNAQLKLHLDFLEGELSRYSWFLGETFSAADIMMSFPLEAARARAGLDGTRPNLMDFENASTRGRLTSALWKKAALTSTPNDLPRVAQCSGPGISLRASGEFAIECEQSPLRREEQLSAGRGEHQVGGIGAPLTVNVPPGRAS